MRRDAVRLPVPGWDHALDLAVYGHAGRPVLVLPSEAGGAFDYENNGMVGAVAQLVDQGRVVLYCAGSLDAATWADDTAPTEERARRHGAYTAWILEQAVPFIHADRGGPAEIITTGCSMGAYHALQLALQRADLFPLAIGLSGNYDPASMRPWGERGDATYFANPADFLPNLNGDHLEWLRSRLSVLLVVGQGDWETHPTGALPSTVAMAAALRSKGIRCELDVWGHDVPHDWPSWRAQIAHHLPRFC